MALKVIEICVLEISELTSIPLYVQQSSILATTVLPSEHPISCMFTDMSAIVREENILCLAVFHQKLLPPLYIV